MINHYLNDSKQSLFSASYIANAVLLYNNHIISNPYNTNIILIFDMMKMGSEEVR